MPKPRPTHPAASGSSAKPRNGWEAARDGDVESIRRLAQAGDPSLWQPGTEGEFTGWRAVDVAVQDDRPESIEALWQTGLPGVRSTFSTHGPRNHLLPAHLAAKLGTLNALMALAEIPEVRDTLFKLFSDGTNMKCAMHFAVERGPGPVEQLVRTRVPQVLTSFYRRAPCGTLPPASFAGDAGPTRRIVESALARAIEQAATGPDSGSIARDLSSVLHGICRYASRETLATAIRYVACFGDKATKREALKRLRMHRDLTDQEIADDPRCSDAVKQLEISYIHGASLIGSAVAGAFLDPMPAAAARQSAGGGVVEVDSHGMHRSAAPHADNQSPADGSRWRSSCSRTRYRYLRPEPTSIESPTAV